MEKIKITLRYVGAILLLAVIAFVAWWIAISFGAPEWLAFLIGLGTFFVGVVVKKIRIGVDY